MSEGQVIKEGQDWVSVKLNVKLNIRTEEYNLNYQFKYSKSVVESGSIVITVPT